MLQETEATIGIWGLGFYSYTGFRDNRESNGRNMGNFHGNRDYVGVYRVIGHLEGLGFRVLGTAGTSRSFQVVI